MMDNGGRVEDGKSRPMKGKQGGWNAIWPNAAIFPRNSRDGGKMLFGPFDGLDKNRKDRPYLPVRVLYKL